MQIDIHLDHLVLILCSVNKDVKATYFYVQFLNLCLCGRVHKYAQGFPIYMDLCTMLTCVSVCVRVYFHCP